MITNERLKSMLAATGETGLSDDDALLASIEVTMKLEDDILACRSADSLRSMQIAIQRGREADVSLFNRALASAKARIAAAPSTHAGMIDALKMLRSFAAPTQPVRVSDGQVEAAARKLAERNDIPEWEEFIPDARAALEAALSQEGE